jgi:hypothetical protein
MQIDKENENVVYNDEQHLYIEKASGKRCISVTTLIEQYGQPFDSSFWASLKAFEALAPQEEFAKLKKQLYAKKSFNTDLIKQYCIEVVDFDKKREEILDAWKQKNKEACDRGTAIHKLHEDAAKAGTAEAVLRLGLGGTLPCRTDNHIVPQEDGVYPELLIDYTSPDGVLRVAGQSDLVVIHGRDLYVIDYKSNAEIKKSSYYNAATRTRQVMQYPLNMIQDCNYWHYVLQLNIYAWMIIRKRPDLRIKLLQLVHYDHNNKMTLYDCEERQDVVERLLKYHHSKCLKEAAYEKLKPIEY